MVCVSWAHTHARCNRDLRHTEEGPSIGCQEKEGSGVCGLPPHSLLHGSKSAYGSANEVAIAQRGHGGSRPEWFSGMPLGSLLAEGTAGAIFEIMEAPVVSVEG